MTYYRETTTETPDPKLRTRLMESDPTGLICIRVALSYIIGFVSDQTKATFGIGFELELKKKNHDYAIFRTGTVDEAKLNVLDVGWYVSDGYRTLW